MTLGHAAFFVGLATIPTHSLAEPRSVILRKPVFFSILRTVETLYGGKWRDEASLEASKVSSVREIQEIYGNGEIATPESVGADSHLIEDPGK